MCGGNSKPTVNETATNPEPPPPEQTDVKYLFTIKTTNQNRRNIDGPVQAKLIGDEGKQTKRFLLTNQTIPNDSKVDFEIDADDIGQPQRLILFYEKTNGKWSIESVKLSVKNRSTLFFPVDGSRKDDQTFSVELRPSDQSVVKYRIEMKVETNDDVHDDDSKLQIKLYGNRGETSTISIDPTTIVNGEIDLNLTHPNVGEIEKVVLSLESENPMKIFHVNNVRITFDDKEYSYSVDKQLGGVGDDRLMSVELKQRANSIYSIRIRTGDATSKSDLEDFLQLSLQGSKGRLEKVLLKDFVHSKGKKLFQRGTIDEFEIPHDDIGKIESVTIGFDGDKTNLIWLFESIEIENQDEYFHFSTNCWLSSRLGSDFSWLNVKTEPKMNYQVIVETGRTDLNANAFLCIYGTDKTTSDLALIPVEGRFPQQNRLEFHLSDVDVGKITKINVGHDGENQEWTFKSIQIIKNDENYSFSINNRRGEKDDQGRTSIELFPDDDRSTKTIYTIIVSTNAHDDSGTDSGVFLSIIGDKSELKQIPLKKTKQNEDASFQSGSVNIFELQLEDVGQIKKINIGHDGKGLQPSWYLQTVEIHKDTEIYRFTADTILDLSMQYTDLIPMPSRKPSPRPSTSSIKPKEHVLYEISAEALPNRSDPIAENAHLSLILVNENGDQSEKIRLKQDRKTNKISERYQGKDLGKIDHVLLGQESNQHKMSWNIRNLTIRYKGDESRFVDQRVAVDGNFHTLTLLTSAEHSAIQYEIKTTTGNESYQGKVTLHLSGERSSIEIPLIKTKSTQNPFQAKAIDEFVHQDKDIGRIRKIQIEHDGTSRENPLHLKKIQICKGRRIYQFDATIRVDDSRQKLILYPTPQRKEDYVESQLRKLRETLRSESAKRRRPAPKAYQPYVYNDLGPYYDTSTVEKAIYEPLEPTTGYYTRLTALRIVEPWEAYGMDFGVSYELMKPTGVRSRSAKRSSKSSQMGMMILPPVSFPFGGQVTYINSARLDDASQHRSPLSSARQNRPLSGKQSPRDKP